MNTTAKPGHRALRKGRCSLPGHTYLVTTTTRNRHPHFLCPRAARSVACVLGDARQWHPHYCLAWVLMPEHWHGLLTLATQGDLASAMQLAKGRSARQFALATGVTGGLWAHGFHDRAMRVHDDLRVAARYIIANPLRAGLVTNILAYPYWNCEWFPSFPE